MADYMTIVKLQRRLCNIYKENSACSECPLFCHPCAPSDGATDLEYEEAERITLAWAKEHPAKTALQDFKEKHPKAEMDHDGYPSCCAQDCGYPCSHKTCKMDMHKTLDCRPCWDEEIEE